MICEKGDVILCGVGDSSGWIKSFQGKEKTVVCIANENNSRTPIKAGDEDRDCLDCGCEFTFIRRP